MWRNSALLLLGLFLASSASAVTQGQQDDFDASVNSWQRGALALGGPGGSSDGFLLLTSTGAGPGGRLVTFNQAQWAGDYTAAGVQAVGVYLNNLGSTDLQIRLALGNSTAPAVGGTWFSSVQSVSLPAGSGWTFALFPVGSADLQSVQGTATYAELMAGVVTLRILHGDVPQAMGDNVVATLGVDRVNALPEPGATAPLGCGLVALALCARARARHTRV